jgi:hypothetical protein
LLKASRILGTRKADPLIHAWRESENQATPLSAQTESGVTIRWERQRDMLRVDDLLYPVLAVKGLPGPKRALTKLQAAAAYKCLLNAAETFGRIDVRDETYGWIDSFERIAVAIEGRLDQTQKAISHNVSYVASTPGRHRHRSPLRPERSERRDSDQRPGQSRGRLVVASIRDPQSAPERL